MSSRFTLSTAKFRIVLASLLLILPASALVAQAAKPAQWRAATEDELKTVIPARAPVVSEKIETEFRSASGITNGKGKFVAGVVLITAGYSAEGKYSHFLLTQVPLKVGTIPLQAGGYVFGWTRDQDSLTVSFYEAQTGKLLGTLKALRDPGIKRVESFRILPPGDKSAIQLGRFAFPYSISTN